MTSVGCESSKKLRLTWSSDFEWIHQEQLICILGCTFVKNALVFFVLKIVKSAENEKAVTPVGQSVLWNPGRISCRCDGGSAGSNRARKRLTCVTNQRHLAFGLHQQRLFGRGQKALQGPAQNFLKKEGRDPTLYHSDFVPSVCLTPHHYFKKDCQSFLIFPSFIMIFCNDLMQNLYW